MTDLIYLFVLIVEDEEVHGLSIVLSVLETIIDRNGVALVSDLGDSVLSDDERRREAILGRG